MKGYNKMNMQITELTDKEASFLLSYFNGSIFASVFDKSIGNQPPIKAVFKKNYDKFLFMMINEIKNMIASDVAITIPITVSEYQKDQKQYKVTSVFILTKNNDKIYSIITKNNNYSHEFIFSMNSELSIGSSPLKEEKKSEISIKAFLMKLEAAMANIMKVKAEEDQLKKENKDGNTNKSFNNSNNNNNMDFNF